MNDMERNREQHAAGGHRARLMPILILALLAMAGCSQNELTAEQPDGDNAPGKKITITASMPEPGAATRLAYDDQTNADGTGKLVMRWKESGEKIYLLNFERNTSSILEQIDNTRSEDGKKTDFTGDLPSNTAEGDILYAYYNSSLQSFDIIYTASNSFPIGDITSDGSLDKMIHPMYAKITHQSGATANFSFKYLTAALKLTFSGLPSGVTLTPLILSGSGEFGVCGSAYADLTKGIPTYSNGKAMGKIDNPILTSPGNTFYTAFIPADLTSGMTITAKGSDNKVYRADLPSINIEAGNIYTATAALTELSISGDIDMINMTPEEVKTAINTALALGFTEIKLTGPIANLGIKEDLTQSRGNPFYNTGVIKVDLSGVTGWQTVAYSNYPDVTSSVAGLPAYTFYGCTALTEVVLPAEVKAIGAGAFTNCTSLSTINLKDVTHIGKQAFGFCKALTAVDLSAVINLYMEAFQETGLTALSLPEALAISDGLTANNLGSHTGSFGDCKSLVSVNAPKLTSTGYKSFSGCSALTALTLPALTEINDEAFYSCKKLTTDNGGFGFAKEVTTVGEKAFGYCTGLTNPVLPEATLINDYAFTGCTAMESLKLPKATRFGVYIVNRCKSLTRIEATASGALTLSDGGSLDNGVAFDNQGTIGDPFDAANCALVLNADKNTGGTGSPTVNGTTWANATWKSITNP